MTRSMTGFGRATRELDGDNVTVELNAVNNRSLDCAVHLPPAWSGLDPLVRETIRRHVSRGRVNVWVERKRRVGSSRPVRFDPEIARQYVDAAAELGRLLGSNDSLSLDVLAQLDGVFYQEDIEEDLDKVEGVIVAALEDALAALNGMRATEGAALANELRGRIGLLRETLDAVTARLPELKVLYEARLHARLEALLRRWPTDSQHWGNSSGLATRRGRETPACMPEEMQP